MDSTDATTDHDSVSGPATWAVCWQAAPGRDFTFQPALVEKIRTRLIRAQQVAGRELLDFLIVPTAIHALVRMGQGDSVAGVAGAVTHIFSRWVREAQPIRGPVFADRYRAEQMLSIEDLRAEVRMMAWRPVVLGLCSIPSHYARGGLRASLGLTASSGFDTAPLLRHFGMPVPEARAALRRLLKGRPSDLEWRAWEMSRGLEMATGNVGPHVAMAKSVGRPAALLIAAGGGYAVDGALDLLTAWVRSRIQPGGPADLHLASSASGVRIRALVGCMAVRHGLCSAASVARYFRRSKTTLSEQMSACRARPVDRKILAIPVRQILEEMERLKGGDVSKRSLGRSRPPSGKK